MTKNLSVLNNLNIAHRGLHDAAAGIPENSMAAFARAVDGGYAIELDLHLLRDGAVAVYHDDNLKRLTGLDRAIKDCTYDEIKDLRLAGTDHHIPLLDELLAMVGGRVLLDIEFKTDNPAGLLESAACQLLDGYDGAFVVKSFNPKSVGWFKKHRPGYIRGQLSCKYKSAGMSIIRRYAMTHMLYNIVSRPDFIAYEIGAAGEKLAKRCRRKKIPLMLWTIRKPEQLARARKLGGSVIFEGIGV